MTTERGPGAVSGATAGLPPPPPTRDTSVISARVHRTRDTTARYKFRFHPYARPNGARKQVQVAQASRGVGSSVEPVATGSPLYFLGSPVFAPLGNSDGAASGSESEQVDAASERAVGGGSGAEILGRFV